MVGSIKDNLRIFDGIYSRQSPSTSTGTSHESKARMYFITPIHGWYFSLCYKRIQHYFFVFPLNSFNGSLPFPF